MNETNHRTKGRKLPSKMVFNAFSPVGAPREPERERYSLSCVGIEEMWGDWGGETNGR